MKNERPSFWAFYFGNAVDKRVYKNYNTDKLYIEKHSDKHMRVLWYIIMTLPALTLLLGWIAAKTDNSGLSYLWIEPIALLLIIIVLYPSRFFIVVFEEIEQTNTIEKRKMSKIEKLLFIGYMIISLLVKFIVATNFR